MRPWLEKGGHGKESPGGSACKGVRRIGKPELGLLKCPGIATAESCAVLRWGRRDHLPEFSKGHRKGPADVNCGLQWRNSVTVNPQPTRDGNGGRLTSITLPSRTPVSSWCLVLAKPDGKPGDQGTWRKQFIEQGGERWRRNPEGQAENIPSTPTLPQFSHL